MKGIVVEINNKEAVVLTDDGLFTKVHNQQYAIGQTIDIRRDMTFVTRRSLTFGTRWVAGAASMAAALAISTIGAFAYYTPAEYVSMDVNPSIEYTLNMFDRILEAKAVNEDGKAILKGLDLENMDIEDALKETLDQLIEDGYLADDPDGGVVITTSDDKPAKAEKLADNLEKEIQSYLDNQKGITAKVDAEAVSPERVVEAKTLSVTPGKLNLLEKLQESTTGAISVDEWLDKPVKEINKAIKENRKSVKEEFEDQSDQSNKPENEKNQNDRETMNQGSELQENSEDSQENYDFTSNGSIDPDWKNWKTDSEDSSLNNDSNNEIKQSDKNNKDKDKSDSKGNSSDDTEE